ncbi:MAG TPA: FAD-binding oxidoreductase [Solirubrobacteraceae bacterium]|nr:FAD-binding oxidoreductase [Solirubrobacteraceae bacterium]
MPTTTNIATRRRTDTTPDFAALDAAIAGAVVAPGAPDWDEARRAWNLAVDQRPAAVALPESARDIVTIVDFARENGLRVAPQGTGHNAYPLAGRLADAILVKTERMRGVQIDPEARIARVEAGALWMDVTGPAAEHGLAALAGSSPDVGVVGYTLGGGVSFLARRYGLSANNVAAVELVTADGLEVRADREHNPDLFWAVRGGGGNFGIVTAIELELKPITEVYAGVMFWPQSRAREVLQSWRIWTQQNLPDEIISVGRLINVPELPMVPEPLRGRSFVIVEIVYLGDERDGEELIAPLRALGPEIDTIATIPVTGLSHLHMDPPEPVPGKGDGMLLGEISGETIDDFVDSATGEAGRALISAEIRHLGGALARPAPEHGALAAIKAPYIMFAVGMAPTPEVAAVVEAQVDAVKDALAPWRANHDYLNFVERTVESRTLYPNEITYRRLQAIKTKYDPRDMVQSNHPIRPAS